MPRAVRILTLIIFVDLLLNFLWSWIFGFARYRRASLAEGPITAASDKSRRPRRLVWKAVCLQLVIVGSILSAPPVIAQSSGQGSAFDLDAPPKTKHLILPGLLFGADVSMELEGRRDFDLDRGTADSVLSLQPELRLAFAYRPSSWFNSYLELELQKTGFIQNDAKRAARGVEFEIKQGFVTFTAKSESVSVQIGRQEFKDPMEWIYDEEMEGLRLFFQRGRFGLEASVSRDHLLNKDLLHDDKRDRIYNYFIRGRYVLGKQSNFDVYVLYRDEKPFRTNRPEDLLFFGLQSIGKLSSDTKYWFNSAYVTGKTRGNTIHGYGFDLGGTHVFSRMWQPSLTLGVAFGSGDRNRSDRIDRDFRQSGLQDNNARFNGVTKFKYLGELFEPEISNMLILTAGVGIRPTKKTSLDIAYHFYRQHRLATRLRDTNIRKRPNGKFKNLGQEVDVILGVRQTKNFSFEGVFGVFFPGRAYSPGRNNALFGTITAKWSF